MRKSNFLPLYFWCITLMFFFTDDIMAQAGASPLAELTTVVIKVKEVEKVIDVIPETLSDETDQDSEPFLTARTNGPGIGLTIASQTMGYKIQYETEYKWCEATVPVFHSHDDGNSWAMKVVVPLNVSMQGASCDTVFARANDIHISYGKTNGALFAGVLCWMSDTSAFLTLQTSLDPNLTLGTFRTTDVREYSDYPWTNTQSFKKDTINDDQVFLNYNNMWEWQRYNDRSGKTAEVFKKRFNMAGTPTWETVVLDEPLPIGSKGYAGMNGPDYSSATHEDGTAYIAYSRYKNFQAGSHVGNFCPAYECHNSDGTCNGILNCFFLNAFVGDIVVLRDDDVGNNDFDNLSSLTSHGKTVVADAVLPYNDHTFGIGHQRVSGHLAIAVNPANSSQVFLVVGAMDGSAYKLNIYKSDDKGENWGSALFTVQNAVNPSLAINDYGEVAFLYQKLIYSGTDSIWETHVTISESGTTFDKDFILNTHKDGYFKIVYDPYLSDYGSIIAVGTHFYGTFAALNEPGADHFPHGVNFLRNYDSATNKLLKSDGTELEHNSIDPFFFKITSMMYSYDNVRSLCDIDPDICTTRDVRNKEIDIGCPGSKAKKCLVSVKQKDFCYSEPGCNESINKKILRKKDFYHNILIKDINPDEWMIIVSDNNNKNTPFTTKRFTSGIIISIPSNENFDKKVSFIRINNDIKSEEKFKVKSEITKKPLKKFIF